MPIAGDATNQGSFTILTVNEARARMGLDQNQDAYLPVLASYLPAAQLHAEVVWASRFTDSGAVLTDVFYLDDYKYGIVPDQFFRCMLRQGLVNTRVPVSVGVSTCQGDAVKKNGSYQEIDLQAQPNLAVLDAIRGILYIAENPEPSLRAYPPYHGGTDSWSNRQRWVTVTYTAGYQPAETGIVFDWIKEAILAYVPTLFDIGQPTNRSNEQEKQFNKAADHSRVILAPYVRDRGFMLTNYLQGF